MTSPSDTNITVPVGGILELDPEMTYDLGFGTLRIKLRMTSMAGIALKPEEATKVLQAQVVLDPSTQADIRQQLERSIKALVTPPAPEDRHAN